MPQRERVGLVGAGAELFQAAWVSVGGVSNSTDYSDWLGRHVYHHSHVAGVSGVCVVSGLGMGMGVGGWESGAGEAPGEGAATGTRQLRFGQLACLGRGGRRRCDVEGSSSPPPAQTCGEEDGRVRIGQVRVGQVAIAWKCAATKHELSR